MINKFSDAKLSLKDNQNSKFGSGQSISPTKYSTNIVAITAYSAD